MLKAKLFTASGPGKASELVEEVEIRPTSSNAYPDVIRYHDGWDSYLFVPTPVVGEYREATVRETFRNIDSIFTPTIPK